MTQESNEQRMLRAYERYADDIFRHCYFRVHEREKAKDVMHETFTKTWAYLADGKEIENIRAFLYRTATNMIIDDSRKKKEDQLDAMLDAGFQPEQDDISLEQAFDLQLLKEQLNELTRDDAELLILRYIDGFKPRDIAKIQGVNVNTISVRLTRAKQRFRTVLMSYEYTIS